MVRYELIKMLPEFTKLIASGILPLSIATKLQVYETFLGELEKNEKPIAIQFTADYYNLSVSQIYKVVGFMES